MKGFESPIQSPEENDKKENRTINSFIGGALLGAAALTTPTSSSEGVDITATQNISEHIKNETPKTLREKISENNRERLGDFFSQEQYTYTTLYQRLTNREVLFTDEKGLLIGEPIKLDPIINKRSDGTIEYISPGALDGRGVPTGTISGSWLNATRVKLGETYHVPYDLANSLPRVRSTIRLVRDAEPFFEVGIKRPETFFDIIEHLGGRQVPKDTEQLSYMAYAHKHFGENTTLPDSLKYELQNLMPGLIAQESQYNNRALSPAGARGMLQIMPDTQKKFGFGTGEITFQQQLAFSGKYFEDARSQLTTRNAEDFTHITNEFFNGNKDDFEKYFLTPVLINSYNAGVLRLSRVVHWFRTVHSTKESITYFTQAKTNPRYDIYAAMATLASENNTSETSGYKEHSSEYFSRVFALAEIIRDSEESDTSISQESTNPHV